MPEQRFIDVFPDLCDIPASTWDVDRQAAWDSLVGCVPEEEQEEALLHDDLGLVAKAVRFQPLSPEMRARVEATSSGLLKRLDDIQHSQMCMDQTGG